MMRNLLRGRAVQSILEHLDSLEKNVDEREGVVGRDLDSVRLVSVASVGHANRGHSKILDLPPFGAEVLEEIIRGHVVDFILSHARTLAAVTSWR